MKDRTQSVSELFMCSQEKMNVIIFLYICIKKLELFLKKKVFNYPFSEANWRADTNLLRCLCSRSGPIVILQIARLIVLGMVSMYLSVMKECSSSFLFWVEAISLQWVDISSQSTQSSWIMKTKYMCYYCGFKTFSFCDLEL